MSTSILIRNDEEGMFGSEGTDGYDVDKTLEKYNAQLRKEIKRVYPDFEVTLSYAPYAGGSVKILDSDLPWNEQEHLPDEIQSIVERVYNGGKFWVKAKK